MNPTARDFFTGRMGGGEGREAGFLGFGAASRCAQPATARASFVWIFQSNEPPVPPALPSALLILAAMDGAVDGAQKDLEVLP